MMLKRNEREELERLQAAFAEAGGRGVDLADRIDELRAKQTNVRVLKVYLDTDHEGALDALTEAVSQTVAAFAQDYGFDYDLDAP